MLNGHLKNVLADTQKVIVNAYQVVNEVVDKVVNLMY